MQFAINETSHGVTRRLGIVEAVNASVAILRAMRRWPPRKRADGTHPMLSTERLTAH